MILFPILPKNMFNPTEPAIVRYFKAGAPELAPQGP
jgi:hypothetical protein